MRPLKNTSEVAVIGGGLAGLTAARHAVRLGRLVTLFEVSGLFGGLVATIDEVEGLSVPGKFSGQALAMHLLEDARKAGVQVIATGIAKLELGERLSLTDESNKIYHPEAIIIASGASLQKLGIPREDELLGRGVSRCATCDGGFFRGQDVVVVGGGDGAVQEALILAKTSRRVIMICRSPMKAKRDAIDKLAARENVSFIWDSEVSAILGEDGVSGVRLRNVKDGTSSDIECAGLFPFIGVKPNTGFVPAALLTGTGHIKTSLGLATSDPRVLAVGAVRADYGGNIVQAMAEGVGAAQSVQVL
jgi:thioredoxin reductase (NADPH)